MTTAANATPDNSRRLAGIFSLALAVVLLAAGVWYATQRTDGSLDARQIVPPNANAERSAVLVHGDRARADVPTVTVYQDFQCPACALISPQLGAPLDTLAARGDIKLQFATLTFLDAMLGNDSSQRASTAAHCADTVGAFAAYQTVVFANQPAEEGMGFTDQQLRDTFPVQAGIDGADLKNFKNCVSNARTADFATQVSSRALAAGINSTPTYLVNGRTMQLNSITSLAENDVLDLITKTAEQA
jgi:protein-disulfide isomerase